MNETLMMIDAINKNAEEVRKENLKRAELMRKEAKKEKAWEIIGLSIVFGWWLYLAWIILQYLAPMFV